MRQLLTVAGMAVLVLAAFTAAPPASSEDMVLKPTVLDLTPIAPISNEGSDGDANRAACTGEWQGPISAQITNWFTGDEIYAVYQDPVESGCALTYPFAIQSVHWDVYNNTAESIDLSPMNVYILAVDYTEDGCRIPGDTLHSHVLYGDVLDPNGVTQLEFSVSSDCVSGPFFIALDVVGGEPAGDVGLIIDDPSPDPARTCAVYNDWGSGWQDLVVDEGWSNNMRMWAEGESSTTNECMCDVDIVNFGPDVNEVGWSRTARNVAATFSDPMDGATITESTFLVRGSQGGMFPPNSVEYVPGTYVTFWHPPLAPSGHAGEFVTATLTRDIQCDDDKLFDYGYSWQFTAAVDPGSPGEFTEPVDVEAVGDGPRKICTADLNGDGILDLATANVSSDNVSVLFGNGDGTMGGASNYDAGNYTHGITAADLDGDGDMDLATAAYSADSVAILLNNGAGVFTPGTFVLVGDGPRAVCAADFDNDGDVDLATTNDGVGDDATILLNNGNATFSSPVSYPIYSGSQPRWISAGDFNMDGYLDLAVSCMAAGTVVLLYNAGDGSFTPVLEWPIGADPSSLALGDFNSDSYLDIAATNIYDGTVTVLYCDGSFGVLSSSSFDAGSQPICVVAGDFNGDENLDLAVANGVSDDVSLFINLGTGLFDTAISYPTGDFPYGLIAGDLDGDDDLDLATVDYNDDAVSVLLNEEGPCCTMRGDLNGDSDRTVHDVVALAQILIGDDTDFCFEAADVNGDGYLSISDLDLLVDVAFNGFPPPPDCDTPGSSGGGSGGIVTLHLNGGDDVAYIGRSNTLEIWLENPDALEALSLGLEMNTFLSACTLAFNPNYDPSHGYLKREDDMSPYLNTFFNFTAPSHGGVLLPDSLLIMAQSSGGPTDFPAGPARLCYSLEFHVSSNTAPVMVGIWFDPIFYPPAGTWTFHDDHGNAPPDFGQVPTGSELDPNQSGIGFDIVEAPGCCAKRGDIDGLSTPDSPDIADLIYMVSYMFQEGPPPVCDEPYSPECPEHYFAETDVNGDGVCTPDIADLIYMVSFMFQEGPPLVPCP